MVVGSQSVAVSVCIGEQATLRGGGGGGGGVCVDCMQTNFTGRMLSQFPHPNTSLISGSFPPPVFDGLQLANTEGEGLEIWSCAVDTQLNIKRALYTRFIAAVSS